MKDITDIIRHVTGESSSQDLSYEKESLLFVSEWDDGTKDNLLTGVIKFNSDGTHESTGINDARDKSGLSYVGSGYYWPNVPIVAFPIKNKEDGSGAEMKALVTPHYTGDKTGHVVHLTRKNVDLNNNEVSLNNYSFTDSLTSAFEVGSMPIEVKRGVTVEGYIEKEHEGYSFSLGHYKCKNHLVAVSLWMDDIYDTGGIAARLTLSITEALEWHNSDRGDWSTMHAWYWQTDIPVSSVPKMSNGQNDWFPASMAVGDFNHDGYKNEIAVAWSDIDHVYLTVLQLSYDSEADFFDFREIYTETIHTYNYNNHPDGKSVGQKLDGMSAQYCVSVVAGDFNGDDKEEFAVVFRDTEHDYQQSYKADFQVNYYGLLGRVHVVTYDWNGSQFLKDEQTRDYNTVEWADYNWIGSHNEFYPGVKAITADVDGDGKDDIALALMCINIQWYPHSLNDDEKQGNLSFLILSHRLDVWTYKYDKKKMEPLSSPITVAEYRYDVSNSHPRYRHVGGTNVGPAYRVYYDRDWMLEQVTRANKPYPFMEREYDLVAGKFTGRFGYGIVDDLVLKYPEIWGNDTNSDWNSPENKIYSAALLVHDIDLDNRTCKATRFDSHAICANPKNSNYGFAVGNFYGEGIELGDPTATHFDTDVDYLVYLQMMPYHVDNLTADGSKRTDQPNNFTLGVGTKVEYENTSSSSQESNTTFSMTKQAQTIFAIDNPTLQTGMKGFQGVRGLLTGFLGDDSKLEKAGKIADKLMDTTETTTSKSNEKASKYSITTNQRTVWQDALYYTSSSRHIWRYPVLTTPVPDWFMDSTNHKPDQSMKYKDSDVKSRTTYLTFAMSDANAPTFSQGIQDDNYQPFYEVGNLFSYPSALADPKETFQVYLSNDMLQGGDFVWKGADITQTITFEHRETNQDTYKKTNKVGAVTKTLSFFDNLFGTHAATIPEDNYAAFSRTVTNQEKLIVNIPTAYGGANYEVTMRPYLDEAGTATMAFAVRGIDRTSTLWNRPSLYTQLPDPSLVLPKKFKVDSIFSVTDKVKFIAESSDQAAMEMRGVRFYVPDYDVMTDNILVQGLKYEIRVPIYNASFVNAMDFDVRLSYSTSDDFNAPRTTIGTYHFDELSGWGSGKGSNRQYAIFTWSADVPENKYTLFVDIDPEKKLKEIHENRRNVNGDPADMGGNNMGIVGVTVASLEHPILYYDPSADVEGSTNAMGGRSSTKFMTVSTAEDTSVFPYIESITVNGMSCQEFLEQVAESKRDVHGVLDIKYKGEHFLHRALFIGYELKPGLPKKTVAELSHTDIAETFAKNSLSFLPGAEHRLHFNVDPQHTKNGAGFMLRVHGVDYPLTEIVYSSDDPDYEGVSSASSGGCNAGLAGLGVLAVLMVLTMKKS